jgi:ketosteroid isomerase-like protein
MRNKPIFPTPQDVEAAFYEALERADLEAMMSVWAEDEEIVCIHPGGPRLVGYASIREAWRRMFDGGARLQVRLSQPTIVQGPLATATTVMEHISVRDDESVRPPLVATNVYVRGALGWRMVLHHASPTPPDAGPEVARKTLH